MLGLKLIHVSKSGHSSLNKIVVLQKRAIRIICNVNRWASTDVLFRELKPIPFLDVNAYPICRFMFRYIQRSVPALFAGYFKTKADTYSHNTRQPLHFHLPNVKRKLGKINIHISETVELKYRLICLS